MHKLWMFIFVVVSSSNVAMGGECNAIPQIATFDPFAAPLFGSVSNTDSSAIICASSKNPEFANKIQAHEKSFGICLYMAFGNREMVEKCMRGQDDFVQAAVQEAKGIIGQEEYNDLQAEFAKQNPTPGPSKKIDDIPIDTMGLTDP